MIPKIPPSDLLLRAALKEDGARRDVTTLATVPAGTKARASLIARESGTAAGLPLFARAFRILDSRVRVNLRARDGRAFKAGAVLAELAGPARALLSAERVALNFLQHLSGIATLTAAYAAQAKGTRARILDTRKTTPGLRALERYAVACGGGLNHRFNLSDMVLIKDNHIKAAGSVTAALGRARAKAGRLRVEVEVENLAQLREALEAGPDIVLLDNMPLSQLKKAVALAKGKVLSEISGGVKLKDVRGYARLGVDRISVGRLTHSAPALDLSLEFF